MERKESHTKETTPAKETAHTKDTPKPNEDVVKNKYADAQKAHKLPPYAQLVDEFEIDTIEPESQHIVREVAKKLFERTDGFRKILEALLQADTSVLTMQEAEFFTEAEHERIALLTRRLMGLDRALLVAELENKDSSYVTYINETWDAWPDMKRELIPIITKMRDGWSKQAGKKKSQHYLG